VSKHSTEGNYIQLPGAKKLTSVQVHTARFKLVTLLSSLRFNGHFADGSGLACTRTSPFWILLKLRVMKVVVTTGAIRRAKLQ